MYGIVEANEEPYSSVNDADSGDEGIEGLTLIDTPTLELVLLRKGRGRPRKQPIVPTNSSKPLGRNRIEVIIPR